VPQAKTVNFTPELLSTVKSWCRDLHETVQIAVEKFGRQYSRQYAFPTREQFPIVVRLKPYQYLLYSGWTPKEFSDLVEFALGRLFGLGSERCLEIANSVDRPMGTGNRLS
jgi:hypothetical protein